jgi:excisionase family DNA binding protein
VRKKSPPRYCRISDIAHILSMSSTTLRRLVERRKIPSYKICGMIRIDWVDVERILAESRIEAQNGDILSKQ